MKSGGEGLKKANPKTQTIRSFDWEVLLSNMSNHKALNNSGVVVEVWVGCRGGSRN
jgi:hypothetical protein